jgi:cold shock protein
MEGTIKKLMRERGFGFIHAQSGQEVFFHRSSLKELNFERLKEGLNVEFELQRGEKGPRAANVRLSWTERARS